jgi:MoaA/NifB/PqqE/SkfB family radical SAM enzyme
MKSIKREYILNSLFPLWDKYNKIKANFLAYPKSGNGFEAISRTKMIEYNKVRIHGAKPIFCYNPYLNIFFNINGNAIACCRSHENILGKYPEQSIKEIWFGKLYSKMREHMSYNDLNMGCDYCKFQLRTKRYHAIPSITPDEYASKKIGTYPKTMELELSNHCNLECIMCSGRVSSAIRKNRENLPPIVSPYDDKFVEQLKEFIPHLEIISFYGGEPFLIDIYFKIWEQIININPKVRIFVVTNGTIYNEKVEYLMKNAKFNILVSIDSLNPEKYKTIRKGAKLELVLRNLEKFNEYSEKRLAISHTPMQNNWDDTPDIINLCNKIGARINLSYVEGPAEFALWAQMPDKLEEIFAFYKSINWDKNNKGYNAKYNIKIFNEWVEQIAYFKDKNEQILNTYKSLQNDWDIAVKAIMKNLSLLLIKYSISEEKGIRLKTALLDIIEALPKTPWHYNSLKNIEDLLADSDKLEKEKFMQYANNVDLLNNLFDDNQQYEFFRTYY